MFDKLSQIAEQAATSVSRRQFLGRFGRAAALAAAAGALLVQPALAGQKKKVCDSSSYLFCVGQPVGTTCDYRSSCVLLAGTVATCECSHK